MFQVFLHHFVLAKLVTTNIRVLSIPVAFCQQYFILKATDLGFFLGGYYRGWLLRLLLFSVVESVGWYGAALPAAQAFPLLVAFIADT